MHWPRSDEIDYDLICDDSCKRGAPFNYFANLFDTAIVELCNLVTSRARNSLAKLKRDSRVALSSARKKEFLARFLIHFRYTIYRFWSLNRCSLRCSFTLLPSSWFLVFFCCEKISTSYTCEWRRTNRQNVKSEHWTVCRTEPFTPNSCQRLKHCWVSSKEECVVRA